MTEPDRASAADPDPPTGAGQRRYELRTLLNEIIGYSDLLIEEAQDWGHQGLAADLRKIRAAGERLLGFEDDLPAPRPAPAPEPAPPPASAPAPVRVDLDYAVLLKAGGAIGLVWLLREAWPVVVLVGVALMFAATLGPLVRRLESRVRRSWGIALVGASVVVAAALPLGIMIPSLVRQGQGLVAHFPAHTQAVEAVLRRFGVPISLSALTQGLTHDAAPQLLNAAGTMIGGIVTLVMVALLTIYLLVDGPRLQMALIRLFPRPERLAVRQVLGTLGQQVGSFMRGQLLASGLAGLFSFLLLLSCRVPEPLALAVWMAVADAIPLVGLLIGTVPAVLLALTRGPTTGVIVAAGYVLYHQIEVGVLVPRIYGSTMKLSGSTILIAILVGGKLLGVVGALFALPVAAALPVVVRYIGQWRDRAQAA